MFQFTLTSKSTSRMSKGDFFSFMYVLASDPELAASQASLGASCTIASTQQNDHPRTGLLGDGVPSTRAPWIPAKGKNTSSRPQLLMAARKHRTSGRSYGRRHGERLRAVLRKLSTEHGHSYPEEQQQRTWQWSSSEQWKKKGVEERIDTCRRMMQFNLGAVDMSTDGQDGENVTPCHYYAMLDYTNPYNPSFPN